MLNVVVLVADPSERVVLAVHLDDIDCTAAIALFLPARAGKRLPILHLTGNQLIQVELGLLHKPVPDPVFHLQRDAEGPGETRLWRHDDGLPKEGRHGQWDGLVVTHAALHEDLVTDLPGSFHAVRVVHANGIDQPRNDILLRDAFVTGILDIAADERGTLVVEVGWSLPLHSDVLDIQVVDAKALLGRFLQEAPCPGAASLVHGVVTGDAVHQIGVFRVLTANLEDGVHAGVVKGGTGGVGDDLVDDAIRECVESGDLSATSTHAEPDDPDSGPGQLFLDRPVAFPRSADRVPLGPQVDAGQDRIVLGP